MYNFTAGEFARTRDYVESLILSHGVAKTVEYVQFKANTTTGRKRVLAVYAVKYLARAA